MPDVSLATCTDLPAGDEDGDLLVAELARAGVRATWVPWTSWPTTAAPDTLVVVRSTWDYTTQRPRFLDWVNGLPRVANEADVIAWNTDKTYLEDLAAAHLPTVPTSFAFPGEQIVIPDAGECVVKPSVGAGSRGAGRFAWADQAAARTHAAALHAAGRTVLVQPYLDRVDEVGETALVYFDGRFSHAVRKGAMLPAGTTHDVDGRALYVTERIAAAVPEPAELEIGAAVCQLIRDRFGADQLYTRVDLLPSPDGPVVIEIELSEPSLFLRHGAATDAEPTEGPSPAEAFANAIAARA